MNNLNTLNVRSSFLILSLSLGAILSGCGQSGDDSQNKVGDSGTSLTAEQQANPLNEDLPGTAIIGSFSAAWADNGEGVWRATAINTYFPDPHFSFRSSTALQNSSRRVTTMHTNVVYIASNDPVPFSYRVTRVVPAAIRCRDGHITDLREFRLDFDHHGAVVDDFFQRTVYTRSLTTQLNVFDENNWFGHSYILQRQLRGTNPYTSLTENYTHFNSFSLRRIDATHLVTIQVLRQGPVHTSYVSTYYEKRDR